MENQNECCCSPENLVKIHSQTYIGVKIVKGFPCDAEQAHEILDRPVAVDDSAGKQGYLVTYEDGYQSWCPKKQFEDANRPCDAMPFGHAIEAAKQGKKIARHGWNGKHMFVVYMPALQLPPFNTQGTNRKVNDRTAKFIGEDEFLDCQPYFAMYNAQKQWIPGWLASQSDMLSDDWFIVE